MKVIYRISDGGYNKIKPHYVSKRGVFLHFMKIFNGYDIYVVADNVSDDTFRFISSHVVPDKIFRTSLHNAGAFMFSVNFAIDMFFDTDLVYFAEDDYIYTSRAPQIIEEGLTIADYSSGYDHPDKYINFCEGGPNPFISEGGELTRVFITGNSHWKLTNSCCMTFAASVRILKQDYGVYAKHCSTTHPHDFDMFCELLKYRKLVSCIPSVSTHGENMWLAKFVDWENEFMATN